MRLLVLGSNGQLGSDLLRLGRDTDGVVVTGLARADLDLAQPSTIAATLAGLDFDVLVNCAAYTAVDAAEADCAAAFAVNAAAVGELARACAREGRRLIHVSTDYVFDGEKGRPYAVEDPPAPLNVYGASKLVGEALARQAHPHGTTIVRTSSVFGLAAAARGGGNFVETMLRVGSEKRRLRVVEDVTMVPTYSADLAQGILSLLRVGAQPGTYHYTNAGDATWYEFARVIFDQAGLSVEVEAIPSTDYPMPARRPVYSVLDTGKATAIVGPAPLWEDALGRYLAARHLAN